MLLGNTWRWVKLYLNAITKIWVWDIFTTVWKCEHRNIGAVIHVCILWTHSKLMTLNWRISSVYTCIVNHLLDLPTWNCQTKWDLIFSKEWPYIGWTRLQILYTHKSMMPLVTWLSRASNHYLKGEEQLCLLDPSTRMCSETSTFKMYSNTNLSKKSRRVKNP